MTPIFPTKTFLEHLDSMHLKQFWDGLSIMTIIATLNDWLPAFAALLSIIWTGIRIYETKTVQRWIKKP